ncbi:protein shisa-9A [Engraulis encrasicolus]|uniref:protein shisa-9A n=1 Tax=Engraulis encrasicolus TaxID=184585 RepID=UPI002FCFE45F
MTWTVFLLGYLLVKVVALLCGGAYGQEMEGFIMITGSNGSRDEETVVTEAPHSQDKCRGYYDVMGQWDPPFVCATNEYLFCCGTCGFRFCCGLKESRLDQSTCTNYDAPKWMAPGHTPYKKSNTSDDRTKDSTNFIVYIICGVVAIMALVGIFTKLGLEKAHRPQRENMSRAVASVMQSACSAEHEGAIAMHAQHYDTMQARAGNLQGGQMNSSVPQQHPYPVLSQIAPMYEQQPGKELNKYASLKAVADKANGDFYSKRRHMSEMAAPSQLPLHPIRMELQEPTAKYITEIPVQKQNGQKPKSGKGHGPSSAGMGYSSNTMPAPGMLKGWDGTETVGRRKSYGHRKPCPPDQQPNQLHTARSHHYLPTQPYFVTNSKTEVTV